MVLRKAIHVAFGIFAFALRWLDWKVSALLAFLAFLHNLILLPRYLPFILREKYDRGVLAYPLSVLALILIFRDSLHVVAAAWAVMAFGDGVAYIIGDYGKVKLPWNKRKSLEGTISFIIIGFLSALAAYWYVGVRFGVEPGEGILLLGASVFLVALVESANFGINDNITVPFSFAFLFKLFSLYRTFPRLDGIIFVGLLVIFILALTAYLTDFNTLPAAFAGFLIGSGVFLFGGLNAFVLLLLFYLLSVGASYVVIPKSAGKYGEKTRGISSVLAKGIPPLIFSYLYFQTGSVLFHYALFTSLAWSTFDTVASEIGKRAEGKTIRVPDFKEVPTGTPGGISFAGLMGGIFSFLIFVFAEFLLFSKISLLIYILSFAAVLFVSFLESFLNYICRFFPRRHLINFLCAYAAGELLLVVLRTLM